VVLYFHENQAPYPMPPMEKRDLTYAYINWASLMAADAAWFNSRYHLEEFFEELPRLLKHFPDYQNLDSIAAAREKSAVMEPGLDLAALDRYESGKENMPRILWNHRWEYDKDPRAFFGALERVKREGVVFELALAGRNPRQEPEEFLQARRRFRDEIVHFGFLSTFSDYARLLWSSHIAVSTARHEFFGMAAAEAMNCRCHPLLPDRLNYPDLARRSEAFLYRDEDELAGRLALLLGDTGLLEGDEARRRAVRFDWSRRAPLFDTAFEAVAQGCA
jgi:glycosyltransferase involved in cell wall biosynthesis